MNRKDLYLLLWAAVLIASYFGFSSYRNNTDRMLARFHAQLKEGKFEQLYDESSDFVHLNVTKENFVQRMKDAVSKMKSIDADLNFQTDKQIETRIFGNYHDDSLSFRRVGKLEKDGKSVLLFIYWENKGLFPKFNDFAAIPANDASGDYQVPGVSYKSISYKKSK